MHMFTDDTDFTEVHAMTVVNMFGGNPNLQRILKHSLGLQYDAELGYPGDDGDDYDNWVHHHQSFGGPLRRVDFSEFMQHHAASSNFQYRPPRSISAPSHDLSSLSLIEVQPKEKDTESKARLIQETKKSKAKAEKKKKKKLKQKERKRREKLEKEKQNAAKNEDGDDGAQQGDEVESKPDCEEDDEEDANSSGNPAAPAEDSDSSGGSEQESSDDDDDSKYDSCASEELDLKSSFVSKAALIAKRKMEQKPKAGKSEKKAADKEEPQTVHIKPGEIPETEKKDSAAASSSSLEDHVQISNDFAVFGNKCASAGDFNMAVKYFTDAIKFNPTEFKLFGNRSFCFEKLHEYEKALADAELSLGISPGWVKGLFRKGRALAGLKRYDEAAQAFRDVLKRDSLCAEAAQELMRVQIIQLMECGFTREQSSNALIIHGTVDKALEVLSKLKRGAGAVQNISPPSMQVVNVTGVSPVLSANISPAPPRPSSPPRAPPPLPAAAAAPASPAAAAARPQQAPKDPPKSKPLDPVRELFPVWVGNLNYTITESVIINLFSKVGTVGSVKVLTARRCAFVNFTKQESCEDAIHRFHGYELNGATLAVRYPDRIAPGMNISKSALRANQSAR